MSLILIRCTYPSLSVIFGLITVTSFYHIIIIIFYHILSYRIIYYRTYLLWKIIILSRANHGQIILLVSICQRRRLRDLLRPPRNAGRAKGQRVPARHRSRKPHPRSRHRRPGDANGFIGFMVNSLTFYMANYHLVI